MAAAPAHAQKLSNSPGLIASLHDVWPGNGKECMDFVERLESWGLSRVALMAVPWYEGRSNAMWDPLFVQWLSGHQRQGNEIFVHGFTHFHGVGHKAAKLKPGPTSLISRILLRLTRNQAEWSGLSPANKGRLLSHARKHVHASGLVPDGFVVPTWHSGPSPRSCFRAGFHLWEGRWTFAAPGRRRIALPLSLGADFGWPPPAVLRRFAAVAPSGTLLRLALHPGDDKRPGIEQLVRYLVETRKPMSYREALNSHA